MVSPRPKSFGNLSVPNIRPHPQTRNKFLARILERHQSIDYLEDTTGVLILDSTTIPHDAKFASRPPVSAFTSPFLGWTLEDVKTFFKEKVQDHNPDGDSHNATSTFIILDERSVTDEMCLIVSMSTDNGTARSDFYLPVELLNAPEMGSGELNEGMDEEEWMVDGEWTYTLEKWKRFMGEE